MLPPRRHMLAIPGSNKTPQRQLKSNNQFPPGPRKEKEPGSSAMQSDIKIDRHPRRTANLVQARSLSQDVSPKPPCPNLRKFQAAIAERLGDFRDARQCRKM